MWIHNNIRLHIGRPRTSPLTNPIEIVRNLRKNAWIRIDGTRFLAPRDDSHLYAVNQQRTARVSLYGLKIEASNKNHPQTQPPCASTLHTLHWPRPPSGTPPHTFDWCGGRALCRRAHSSSENTIRSTCCSWVCIEPPVSFRPQPISLAAVPCT